MRENIANLKPWARFIAMDEDGSWYQYQEKPEPDFFHRRFINQDYGKNVAKVIFSGPFEPIVSWHETLEELA